MEPLHRNLLAYVVNDPVNLTDLAGFEGAKYVVGTIFSGPYDIDPVTGRPNVSAYTGKYVDPTQPGASLPFKFSHDDGKLPNICIKIRSHRTGLSIVAPILDAGPHSTTNDYWNRPNGDSTNGSRNRSGLDMTPAAGRGLGLPVSRGSPGHPPAFKTLGDELFDWEFTPCCDK